MNNLSIDGQTRWSDGIEARCQPGTGLPLRRWSSHRPDTLPHSLPPRRLLAPEPALPHPNREPTPNTPTTTPPES